MDLLISDDAGTATAEEGSAPSTLSARWVPQQGLTMTLTSRVMSKVPADKLLAISTANAFTLECWVSIDTMYPVTDANALFTWDSPVQADGSKRNLSLATANNNLILTPMGGASISAGPRANALHTGLQHIVVTWDGATTRVYHDGAKKQELTIAWKPNQMLTGSSLILGNGAGMTNAGLGTFYLLAIHDRCFTDADVLRHYTAGPSAR